MLTAKQEKFVHNIVKGMSQIEAYKDAYNANRMSDNAISVEASRLMQNPKIALRHKELADAVAKPAIMTAQERLEFLTRVIKGEEKEKVMNIVNGEEVVTEIPSLLKTKLNAVDIMNKMQGEYVTKIDADVSVKKLEDLL